MFKSISSGLLYFTIAMHPVVAIADQKENYCPEKDFVRLCLAPVNSEAEMREWVLSNGWSWQDYPDRLIKNHSPIKLYKRDAVRGNFNVSIIEFSDVTEVGCFFDFSNFAFLESPRICDLNFPAITEKLGDSIETDDDNSLVNGGSKAWEYKTDNSRGHVIVGVDKSGKVSHFSATKYILK